MNHPRFFLLFQATCLAMHAAEVEAPRPHIILVMADDQGWGDMAYHGHPAVQTPNFDKAAASGIRFDRFYAAAPVCSPTRASVLTGRTPNRTGAYTWGHPLRLEERTLPEILREAGYTTGHFGKWHLGSVRRESASNPGAHGFDRWISAPNFYENGATLSDEGRAVTFDGVESSFIAVNPALEWIEKSLNGDKPIFAVIWFGSPHLPHVADETYTALYPDASEKERNFLGELTGMDRAYGKLRGRLDELGIRENTLLWYCSDNGALPGIGRTGGFRGHKGEVYEGGLLVPAILEWPTRFPGHRIIEARANTCDILPTVLDAAGIAAPADRTIDGESLMPLLKGERAARNRPMGFWHTDKRGILTPSAEWMAELKAAQSKGEDLPENPQIAAALELPDPPETRESLGGHAAWIEGGWKLHRVTSRKSATVRLELYDLAADPHEENNLAQAEPERTKIMTAQLERWMDSVVNMQK